MALKSAPMVLALSHLCLASSLPPVDEVSLLQVYSGMNWNSDGFDGFDEFTQPSFQALPEQRNAPVMAEALPQMSLVDMGAPPLQSYAGARRSQMPSFGNELSSLDQATAGIERQLQKVQEHTVPTNAFSTLQEYSEVASLKRMVQDLRSQSDTQASQLTNALEQQRISNSAVDHAKQQLENEIKNTQQAWQSEEKARESERQAWRSVAQQQAKDKNLEDQLEHTNEEVQKMVQQREDLKKKLEQLQTENEKVSAREHKAWEVSMLQAKNSEKKAWSVAVLEGEKALAERKLKERLLAEAKAQLSHMKSDVSNVQKQASELMKKEVQEVKKKVENVKEEANANLHKAAGQLHKEHAQVKSVVEWANQVQQQADAKMHAAKQAQQQVANNVNWAEVAKREASRASAAIQQVEELRAAARKNDGAS